MVCPNFKIGDKIVSSHHIPCFNCIYCKHESFSMCEHFKNTNIYPGGFSEKIYLSEEHLKNVAYKVPDNITEEEISFYEPLACCIRAIKRCNLQNNDKILTIGLGSIGLLMCEGLKAYGYETYGCDLLEERLNIANEHGIEAYNSINIDKFSARSGGTISYPAFSSRAASKAESARSTVSEGRFM